MTRYNLLFGGPAGSGPNIVTNILGEALVKLGHYVFYSRDYQSLIRGGHNFNVITFSEEPVNSNDSKMDIIVAFDELTENLHKKELKKNGVVIKGEGKGNMYYAGRIFKLLCIDFKVLDDMLKELGKKYDENVKDAKLGYDEEKKNICKIIPKKGTKYFMNGNQAVAEGAVSSGLNVYYGYPMTPATSLLNELADKSKSGNNLAVIELENEIAVANAGVGSAATGALAMVGSSGGGIDLMTEALSMTGMAEIPLVFFLAQRPGPGTGVPTYNSQGDLNMARHAGHGEFQRIVLTPGDPKDAFELTNQAFYLSQKFKVPSIIVSDKHLGESFYTLDEKGNSTPVIKTIVFGRFNSYETDETGSSTENPEIIKKNFERRIKKVSLIKKDSAKFSRYEIFGSKTSKNVLVSYGSTKGAIVDALKNLKCKFIQIKYIEPFPEELEKEFKNKNLILIENDSTGILGEIIAEKTGIRISDKNKILRYDGRPFLADELEKEIKSRLK